MQGVELSGPILEKVRLGFMRTPITLNKTLKMKFIAQLISCSYYGKKIPPKQSKKNEIVRINYTIAQKNSLDSLIPNLKRKYKWTFLEVKEVILQLIILSFQRQKSPPQQELFNLIRPHGSIEGWAASEAFEEDTAT